MQYRSTWNELGLSAIKQERIKLVNKACPVVSVTTGAGVGGVKIKDFDLGHINVLGATASIAVSVAAAKQADFTDGTPEGDIGIGTAAPADADALGVDATDDNICTAAALTMAAFASSAVKLNPDAAAQIFDGSTTAVDVFVNVLIDAADINDSTTSEVLLNGTVVLTYINLGDN